MTNNLYFDYCMKRILLLMLMLAPVLAFTQDRFPDYYTVVSKFFSLYHHEDYTYETLAFARKKDGWYVQLLDRANNEAVKRSQLFWSQRKGRYQVLEDFVGATSDALDDKVMSFIFTGSPYNSYGYDRCVYYGYNGWDADIIKDFGNTKAKSDTLLEGLARAYSAFASRYLWYQYGGDKLSNDTLQRKLGRLEMPGNERMQRAAGYIDKSADCYQQIQNRNNDYQTMVGGIGLKIFNERFHGYMQMMLCNQPGEAAKFLEKCFLPYDDSVAAQNLFHSIGEKGIIITYGDNDTYPLLFLQEKYNTRKDVAVLNYNMLGLPVYLDMLKRKNVVNFSTTASEYGNAGMDYSYYYKENDMGRKQQLKDFVAGYKNLPKLAAMNGDSVKIIDLKKLSLDTLQIELGNYLLINDFIIFDIIVTNLSNRPIYINDETGTYFAGGLSKRGITWQLLAPAKTDNYINESYTAPFTNYKLFSSEYDYNVNVHTLLYMTQAQQKLNAGDKAAAAKLIKDCFAPFGNKTPYVSNIVSILPLVYETGNDALGDQLAETYISTVVKNYEGKLQAQFYSKDFPIKLLEQLQPVLAKYKRNQSSVNAAISGLGL